MTAQPSGSAQPSANARPSRSSAEWAALVGATVLVVVVIALILIQVPGGEGPAAPTAHVENVRRVGDTFHVEVTVSNHGDRTAENLQVSAELTIEDETYTGDQTIDFLAGGADHDLVFVFDDYPTDGDLRVAVTGFAVP